MTATYLNIFFARVDSPLPLRHQQPEEGFTMTPRKTIRRDVRAGSGAACPIKPLIAEFEKLLYAYEECDHKIFEDGVDRFKYEDAQREIWARMQAIEAQVKTQSARSIEGAMFQIAVCVGAADMIKSSQENEGWAEDDLEAIRRMVYSSINVIEEVTGALLPARVREYLICEKSEPGRLLDRTRRGQTAVTASGTA